MVIKWEDVVQVQKRSDGVTFVVRSPKTASYDFIKLFNSEKAWASLVSLHNDSIIDKPRREPTPRQFTRSLRRMSSDPSRMSFVFDLNNTDDDGGPASDGNALLGRRSALREKREASIILARSESAPVGRDMDMVKETRSQESLETQSTPFSQNHTKRALEQQWSSVMEESALYSEKAVERHELPCSLETFFELFIGDDAKYSVPTFMKESGDEELQCSPWKDDSKDGVTKRRTVEYTHPINAPMAPPMARARKEQSYQIFGEKGIILETKTYVADVPLTDCFYVADQILVEPVDDHRVSVTMSFSLEFVKSTMFKSIIMRTTKGEFQSFMQRLANFMSTSLGQAASAVAILPAVPAPPPEPARATGALPTLTAGLLCLVFLLQLWIIMDMRTMKSDLRQLLEKPSTECPAIFGLGGLA